jgi:cell division protein ZapA
MAQVTLNVAGYAYNVACRDGEEAHLLELAAVVDSKAKEALSSVTSASEVRQMLFASLLLADELKDAQGGKTVASVPASAPSLDLSALESVATRLESLATKLENSAA